MLLKSESKLRMCLSCQQTESRCQYFRILHQKWHSCLYVWIVHEKTWVSFNTGWPCYTQLFESGYIVQILHSVWKSLKKVSFTKTLPIFEPKMTQKCRNSILLFWHFPSIFVSLKLTCLVTLFDSKLQVFKNSPNWPFFGIFNELLSTQNVNAARFARNVEWDFFCDFQTNVKYRM